MIIYFAEKPNDKFSDLYLSTRQPDGHFSRPVKLKITSVADDFAPFIAPDQKDIVFRQQPIYQEIVWVALMFITRLAWMRPGKTGVNR